MIPTLVPLHGSPWPVLPPGEHGASLADVAATYAYNRTRKELFDGLVLASGLLLRAGCQRIFLDGSFVTKKPIPGDYDACWDPAGIDWRLLDPRFRDFSAGRAVQKAAFRGEFFPASTIEANSGRTFVEFFQVDRFTGAAKGILSIQLVTDPVLAGSVP